MKALLDLPLPRGLMDVLAAKGYQAIHALDLGLDRASDLELLRIARENSCLLVSVAQDLRTLLAASTAEGPGLLMFRGGAYGDRELGKLLGKVLDSFDPLTLDRSICIADSRQVRITRLPTNRQLR